MEVGSPDLGSRLSDSILSENKSIAGSDEQSAVQHPASVNCDHIYETTQSSEVSSNIVAHENHINKIEPDSNDEEDFRGENKSDLEENLLKTGNIAQNGSESKEDSPEADLESVLGKGVEFNSYKALRNILDLYEESTGVKFARSGSLTVEKAIAFKRPNASSVNPDIVFMYMCYRCIYGGEKKPSRSLGIRNVSSRKRGCPVYLRVAATPDGQRLVIKESLLDCHNHDLEKDKSRLRKLDEETEMEIYSFITLHENKRMARIMIRDRLIKETGKDVKLRDVVNIEKRIEKKVMEKNQSTEAREKIEQNSNSRDGEESTPNDDNTATIDNASHNSVSSPQRPKRCVRKPKRFKEFQKAKKDPTPASAENTTVKQAQAIVNQSPGTGRGRPKIKLEPVIEIANQTVINDRVIEALKSRKRKLTGDSGQSRPATKFSEVRLVRVDETAEFSSRGKRSSQSAPAVEQSASSSCSDPKQEWTERKLRVQEELLKLERQKMKMMQEMMGKLNTVLENQEKEKQRHEAAGTQEDSGESRPVTKLSEVCLVGEDETAEFSSRGEQSSQSAPAVEQSASSSCSDSKQQWTERKLCVEEELLLERQKMKMMQEMMGKLNTVLENQGKEKQRHEAAD